MPWYSLPYSVHVKRNFCKRAKFSNEKHKKVTQNTHTHTRNNSGNECKQKYWTTAIITVIRYSCVQTMGTCACAAAIAHVSHFFRSLLFSSGGIKVFESRKIACYRLINFSIYLDSYFLRFRPGLLFFRWVCSCVCVCVCFCRSFVLCCIRSISPMSMPSLYAPDAILWYD